MICITNPDFWKLDRLTLIAELIGPQFQENGQHDIKESLNSGTSEGLT